MSEFGKIVKEWHKQLDTNLHALSTPQEGSTNSANFLGIEDVLLTIKERYLVSDIELLILRGTRQAIVKKFESLGMIQHDVTFNRLGRLYGLPLFEFDCMKQLLKELSDAPKEKKRYFLTLEKLAMGVTAQLENYGVSIIKLFENTKFKAGDIVRHKHSGEKWTLAVDQEGAEVVPCGWPETFAQAAHCELIKSATPEERLKLLKKSSE